MLAGMVSDSVACQNTEERYKRLEDRESSTHHVFHPPFLPWSADVTTSHAASEALVGVLETATTSIRIREHSPMIQTTTILGEAVGVVVEVKAKARA